LNIALAIDSIDFRYVVRYTFLNLCNILKDVGNDKMNIYLHRPKDNRVIQYCAVILLLQVLSFSMAVYAKDLKATIAELPPNVKYRPDGTPIGPFNAAFGVDGTPVGPFVEIVKAIDNEYREGRILLTLFPFSRSLKNLEYGLADFHIPIIRSPFITEVTFPYAYSTESWGKVAFVLYTNAKKPRLDKKQLGSYQIEVMRGQTMFYNFKTTEGDSSTQGIEKIIRGRIDGYIGSQETTDAVIIERQLKGIRRELFYYFDACLLIAKGSKQKHIDKILSSALKKLKENGKLQEIVQSIHKPYNNWQPYEMGW